MKRRYYIATFIGAILAISGTSPVCAEGSCRPNGKANDSYVKSVSCWLLVNVCTSCTYDDRGMFVKEKMHPCGICIGLGFGF
jgi:hypothetical protein